MASRSHPECAATPATSGAEPSAAFTPGPWRWIVEDDEYQTLNALHPDGGGAYVITPEYDSPNHKAVSTWIDIGAANARLIAAAPDLLEALRAIVKPNGYDVGGNDGLNLERAREAIAKALSPSTGAQS